ncbi:MAG: hypothetical protein MNPFHGCM_00174 [Gemmatimonadaceae bacterium]|nr:hypothetical protein [Gemmatimonadaceae bacterium]
MYKRLTQWSILALTALAPLGVQAQRIITPGSGIWSGSTRGSNGTVAITGMNPRSGNGSLELTTSGNPNDWAFFNLFSGDPATTQGWGKLSEISHLQFDWWRSSDSNGGDPVWEAQSPVLRLYVRSGDPANPVFSEIVWERWYNLTSPTPRDQWITEDVTNQMFWRYVSGAGYTIDDCSNPPDITPGIPLKTETPQDWGNGQNCYLPMDAVVYGIGVGVGSSWPLPYHAFIDNVQLSFNGREVVNDNFEFDPLVAPEPATLALLATGLAGLGGGAAARRRRRSKI